MGGGAVPPPDTQAALDILGQMIDEVGVTTDMAHPTLRANLARKRVLLTRLAQLQGQLDRGKPAAVDAGLEWMHRLVDGSAKPPDWVVWPAAARIATQVDRARQFLAEPVR
jgi:hypothetical protein